MLIASLQEVKDNPDSPTSSDDEDSREREEKTEIKEEEGDEPPVKRERKKTGEERETITKTITITRKEKSGWFLDRYFFSRKKSGGGIVNR